jgi:hypothetical protein
MTIPASVLPAAITSDAEGATDEPATLTGADNSISEASKAFRANAKAAPAPAVMAADTDALVETQADTRPRNPDGTFAAVVDAEGDEATEDVVDVATDTPDEAAADVVEPKLFKLAGETQRGEEDIELDVTDLPPEVVERLERLESRGMRRKEYDTAMSKVTKVEQELAEFETLLAMDPDGVIMQRTSPAAQLRLAGRLLLEHWDTLAPEIQKLWDDDAGRVRAMSDLREGSRTLSDQVERQIAQNRSVVAIRRAIDMTIPDGIDPIDAHEYRAAANTRLAALADNGTSITPDVVAQHLAPLAARYGFQAQDDASPAAPPARPKLAVYRPAQPGSAASTGTPSTTPPAAQRTGVQTAESMSPSRFSQQVQDKTAARAVAPSGAGALPVRRPAPPETASIEEASAFLRGTKQRR